MKAFRVYGTTDDVTTCELCGKAELKGTVMMMELDAEGNDFELSYYGTSCAAKAAGWTQKRVKDGVKEAVAAARAIAERARAERNAREDADFVVWAVGEYGITANTRPEAQAALVALFAAKGERRAAFSFWVDYREHLKG